jgi:CheY-specific phosphatase CheX
MVRLLFTMNTVEESMTNTTNLVTGQRKTKLRKDSKLLDLANWEIFKFFASEEDKKKRP